MKHIIGLFLLLIASSCGGAVSSSSGVPSSSVSYLSNATVALVASPYAYGPQRVYCSGSFIAEDVVLTAAHCIGSESAPVRVATYDDYQKSGGTFNGRWSSFYVTRIDVNDDLAILKAADAKAVTYHEVLDLADDYAATGEPVVVIGHPAGILAWTFTQGIVSREVRFGWGFEQPGEYRRMYMQYSANSYYGNSGGPIVNMDNELVGMVSEGHPETTYLGMATHLHPIKRFLRK